jgi:hypothetical protein
LDGEEEIPDVDTGDIELGAIGICDDLMGDTAKPKHVSVLAL